MSRKLQHITTLGQRDDAERDGEKVTTLCGKRIYPMVNMKPEIPTCTPCSIGLREAYNSLLTNSPPPGVWTWFSTSTTVNFPEAAS